MLRWLLKPDFVNGIQDRSPLASEFSLFLLYAGNPFYSYPHKTILATCFGSSYERSYRHFRDAHSQPLNIGMHLACLVYSTIANACILQIADLWLGIQDSYASLSLINLVGLGVLLLPQHAAPLAARVASAVVLLFAYSSRVWCLRNWTLLVWCEVPLWVLNVKLSDAKAVPSLPTAPLTLLLAARLTIQTLVTHMPTLVDEQHVTMVNAVAVALLMIGSIRPFHHYFNCYWSGYLGWILALSINQPFWFFHGAGFGASLFQGVAHELCAEAANLPALAKRSGVERAADEIGHVSYFPVLIFHSAHQSIFGGLDFQNSNL